MRTMAGRIHLCMIGTISAVQILPESFLLQCFGSFCNQGLDILIVLKLQLEKFEGTQSVLETKWQEQLLCVIISVDREVEDIS